MWVSWPHACIFPGCMLLKSTSTASCMQCDVCQSLALGLYQAELSSLGVLYRGESKAWQRAAQRRQHTSMGRASMSVLSANFGSPLPMVARMPVSAMGCLYAMLNLSS